LCDEGTLTAISSWRKQWLLRSLVVDQTLGSGVLKKEKKGLNSCGW
jgi:hypothetical protein